jgi:hypothetical protein
MSALSSMHRSVLIALVIAVGVAGGAERVHAADLVVEPLVATGLPEDATPDFQGALEQAFDKAGHKVVRAGHATLHARTSVTKDRSQYNLTVTVLGGTGKKPIEKTTECAPCTLEQARQQLELVVRTISLDLDALEETAPAVPLAPPVPAVAPSAPIAVPIQVQQPPPAPPTYEYTGWYQFMIWTAALPAAAGMVSAVRVSDGGQSDCTGECPKDGKRLALAVTGLLLSESFGLFSLIDLTFADPRPGKNTGTVAPWCGLIASAVLGAFSYALIKNDGYGSDFYKRLGYADISLAALAATTSIGSLVAGTSKPGATSTTAFVGPGFGGVRIRF